MLYGFFIFFGTTWWMFRGHRAGASGVLAQSEACVLSKHEVLGSKPRYSNPDIRYGVVGNISACHADARGSIPRFGVVLFYFVHLTTKVAKELNKLFLLILIIYSLFFLFSFFLF